MTLPKQFPRCTGGAGVVQSAGPGAEVWLGRRVAFVCLGRFPDIEANPTLPDGTRCRLKKTNLRHKGAGHSLSLN